VASPLGLPRLHVLTDEHLQHRFTHFELAQLAKAAGSCVIQFREKAYQSEKHLPQLQAMVEMLDSTRNPLVINDSITIARQVSAAGVHLGKGDGNPAEAVGQFPIVGATVHSIMELEALAGVALSYIGVGPVFGTTSKETGLPMLGLKGLMEICKLSPYPVIAIGSLRIQDVRPVLDSGAYGLAVLSGFACADDPKQAVEGYLEALDS
jgi:thiamine-phosphate pyrophosphorylase